jgi:hypothetical protein
VNAIPVNSVSINGQTLPLIAGYFSPDAVLSDDDHGPKGWSADLTIDGEHSYETNQDISVELLTIDDRTFRGNGWIYNCQSNPGNTSLVLSGGGGTFK